MKELFDKLLERPIFLLFSLIVIVELIATGGTVSLWLFIGYGAYKATLKLIDALPDILGKW